MAEGIEDAIDNALNTVVNTIDLSGNVKKELKKTIHETVSKLRTLFVELKKSIEDKTAENDNLQKGLGEVRAELEALKSTFGRGHVAPAMDGRRDQRTRGAAGPGEGPPSSIGRQNLYSEVLAGKTEKKFKLTVKSKKNHPPETTKQILKASINPAEMKVGINTFKSLRDGQVLIETSSKEELESLRTSITSKCGDQLEVNTPKLRNPRLIIYNVPEDISAESAAERIICQNPELNLNDVDIQGKYCYKNKFNKKNMIIEVSSQARRELLKTKIKLGWQICNARDYLVATRCFKCSRFNHRQGDCKGTQTCPLCSKDHTLKECTASRNEYKCVNCATYNKYCRTEKSCEKHSSLDKNCPSLQAVLGRYVLNINY